MQKWTKKCKQQGPFSKTSKPINKLRCYTYPFLTSTHLKVCFYEQTQQGIWVCFNRHNGTEQWTKHGSLDHQRQHSIVTSSLVDVTMSKQRRLLYETISRPLLSAFICKTDTTREQTRFVRPTETKLNCYIIICWHQIWLGSIMTVQPCVFHCFHDSDEPALILWVGWDIR